MHKDLVADGLHNLGGTINGLKTVRLFNKENHISLGMVTLSLRACLVTVTFMDKSLGVGAS